MEALGTYLEKTNIWHYRRFELFNDCIVVTGKFVNQPESCVKVELRNLRAEPNKIFIRDRIVSLCVLFLIAFTLPYAFSKLIILIRLINSLSVIEVLTGALPIFAIAALATVIMKFICPPIEYAQFVQREAGIPLLDIAKAGPDKDKHKDFLVLISSKISEKT